MPASTPSPGLFGDQSSRPAAATDWISAHCDGGARGNPGPAGYGAIIHDGQGHVLAELSEFLGFRTNNFAEYSGLLGCLQWALDNGHTRLRVVSDSELMVKQIQGKYKVSSPDLRPLWEEARRRIALLQGFEISHALRHKNKEADRLANEAMDRGAKRPPPPAAVNGQAPPRPVPRAEEAAVRRASAADLPRAKVEGAKGGDAGPRAASPGALRPSGTMLRGFTRDGVVHVLGGDALPDGVFVKILVE